MKEKNLKNKLLFIFCFCIFIVLNITNSVFASSEIIDKINTYVTEHYYGGAIHIVLSTEEGYVSYMLDGTKVTISLNADNKIQLNSTGFTRNVYYYFDEGGNYISVDNGVTMGNGSEIITSFTNQDYLYSSISIYNSKGEIVNPYQPVLFQITQAEQIPETMNKVLQIIIPVGLKILLVGLIIFLIRWVILRVT